jgi:phospholipase/carboxylesterase
LIDLNHSSWRPAQGHAQKELWFLHGYASDENDLFGLARLIPSDWNVRSLRAPRPLNTGGYAWYDLHFDSNGVRQVGMDQVVESLIELRELLEQATLKPILFGFSQGGIVANALAASNPELMSGCVAVASYFPNDWFKGSLDWNAAESLAHLAVVGDEDGVYPPAFRCPAMPRPTSWVLE